MKKFLSPRRRDLLTGGAAAGLLATLGVPRGAARAATGGPVRRFILIKDGTGAGHTKGADGSHHRMIPRLARDAAGKVLPRSQWGEAGLGGSKTMAFASAMDLPAALDPLAEYWRETLIVDRLMNPFDVGLHGNGACALSYMPPNKSISGPSAITIDSAIAKHLSKGLAFPLMGLAQKPEAPMQTASAPGIVVPPLADPLVAYKRYFNFLGADGKKALANRQRVSNYLHERVASLSKVVGQGERQRLDQLTQSLTDMEDSLRALGSLSCTPPPLSKPPTNPGFRDPLVPAVSQVNVDLAASALSCGLTNVATLTFVTQRGSVLFLDAKPNEYNLQGELHAAKISQNTRYQDLRKGLTIETDSWSLDRHNNSHAGNEQMLTAIDRWEAALVARLIEQLKAVPEPDGGTMWDHTLVLWINGGGGIHHGGASDYPALLLGGAPVMKSLGGFTPGRYVSFERKSKTMGDLFTSVARLCGLEIEKFGDTEHGNGALPGIRS